MSAAIVFFWIPLGLVVYSYAVYPAALALLRRITAKQRRLTNANDGGAGDAGLPSVSIIIAAYNESHILDEKLRNLAAIDYPPGKIEFCIGSDGSTDRTDEILRGNLHGALRPALFPERRGKAAVLNDLVGRASGEVLVFSDANTLFSRDAVRKLVRHYKDASVGGVLGELIVAKPADAGGFFGESAYWTYENRLKRLESDIATTLGGTGPLYSIRKQLYVPLPTSRVVTDDFLIPMGVIKAGFAVKYDREAQGSEKTSDSLAMEFSRKVRISAGNFGGLREFAAVLHPRFGFAAFALWSHKILRWFVPFYMISAVASTAILAPESIFFRWLAAAMGAFVAIAAVGFVSEQKNHHIGIMAAPYYLLAMNAALMTGLVKYLFGLQKPAWEVLRHRSQK